MESGSSSNTCQPDIIDEMQSLKERLKIEFHDDLKKSIDGFQKNMTDLTAENARLSQELQDRQDKSVCCTCLERLPQTRLSCGHMLCATCANKLFTDNNNRFGFPCPTCRQSVSRMDKCFLEGANEV